MRISINSSIANVIRRYRAAAVEMVRMDLGSTSFQWHKPISASVQPTSDAHQSGDFGLLTGFVRGMNRFESMNLPLIKLPTFAHERLSLETIGRNSQQCPATLGTSGIGTVS